MEQKHPFDVKAFRKQRIPLLLLAMFPSFILDGYLIYGMCAQMQGLLIPHNIVGISDTLAPLALNLIFLKAPFIYAYMKVHLQYQESYVLTGGAQVV